MNVLLSVKPKYAEAILSGEKKYEFRRVIPKELEKSDRIYLYSNDSVQKIVGYFELGEILEERPQLVWERCQENAGMSREDFFDYFEGADKAYAMEISDTHRFSEPINPYEKINGFTPPQSFQYISDTELLADRLTAYG